MSNTVAIFSIFTGLATVAVALRLITRLRVVRTAGWDDWLIVLALLTDYVFFAFAILETHYGLGTSRNDLTQSQITHQLKAFYITIPFYNLTLSFTKISMLVLYLRLLPMMSKYRLTVTISLCVIPLIALWLVLSSFMFCIPVSDFWSPVSQQRCLPKEVWFLNAALQIATDMWTVFLPMPVLARLKLPRRQKVAVVLVFGLGIFVCIVSIVRISALTELTSHNDDTRYNSPAAIWSSIEANVAIICSSLPPLRPLIVRLLPSSLRTSSASEQERPVRPYSSFGTRPSWGIITSCISGMGVRGMRLVLLRRRGGLICSIGGRAWSRAWR
ncbi:uncharacterized protein ASPGLDRAFT_158201 [Aspergillus glaucus CBS 516.65]|uniref:Rhodopsin domain-containing protein n=1 Tax=Aspergillus glaucus CBS 516.65 TaxID=1160497 RepID=A0A1L9V7L5_ASPGL|nr:hypothetical protein ASPGLDRAFT_158201 [Aspergillus glaucus CBS 516.65]OJJ79927.1 hypothetical protein ASPGLDRAFT_158201 [Aspergillus glaucus CBS 516.65]